MTTDENFEEAVLRESPVTRQAVARRSDWAMLEDSLAMTLWERILANDDTVNFGDSLHAAMERENAKSR